jgi:hypothetical protein
MFALVGGTKNVGMSSGKEDEGRRETGGVKITT